MALNLTAAINFLKSSDAFNTIDNLAKTSTNPGGSFTSSYFIHSANGLWYSVMNEADPTLAYKQLTAAVNAKSKFGKCSNTLYSYWADNFHPTWRAALRAKFGFNGTIDQNWGTLSSGWSVLNNDMSGISGARSPTENKIDVQCHYIINQMCKYYNNGTTTNLNNAKTIWANVLSKFNDSVGGYVDEVTGFREMFKLGLVKICGDFPELSSQVGPYIEPTGLWDGNVQDSITGGIGTRYTSNGTVCNRTAFTYSETESTSTVVLGYRSSNGYFP